MDLVCRHSSAISADKTFAVYLGLDIFLQKHVFSTKNGLINVENHVYKISKEGKTAFMLIFEMAKPSALTNLNLQIVFFAISTFDRVEEYHCGNCDSIVLFYDSSNLAQLNLVGLYIFLWKV